MKPPRSRRQFLGQASLGLAATALLRPSPAGAADALAAVRPAVPGAPNLLLILAEDIGPELGCYRESWAAGLVRTPHLDRLAREGVRFTRMFTTSPVCSASRSALMTGMYQTAIGCHHHRTWPAQRKPLPPGVHPLTDYFRAAGYFTCNVTAGRRRDPVTGERLPTGGDGSGKTDLNFPTQRLFDGSDWNERAPGQPFFAQLTIQESHKGYGWPLARRSPDRVPRRADPAAVPVPPYYPDHPVVRDEMANYLDAIMLMDSYVGDILARLEREGRLQDTVVVFMGDNGQCLARGKQFLYDGGIHVPLLIRWPDGRRAGEVDGRLLAHIDLSATLLAMAGITPGPAMQGRSFLDPAAPGRDTVFLARDRMDLSLDRIRGLRTTRWKYLKNFLPAVPFMQYNAYKERQYPTWNLLKELAAQGRLDPVQALFAGPAKPLEELYDLETDPHEVRNLAGDPAHAARLKDFRARTAAWIVATGDPGAVMEDPVDNFLGYWGHLPEDPKTDKPSYTND